MIFWEDAWNGRSLQLTYPHVYSFVKKPKLTLPDFTSEPLYSHFHLPLTAEAYQQYMAIEGILNNLQLNNMNDIWRHMGQSGQYSCSTVYKHLSGHSPTNPAFRWLWNSSCQPKHKVFFWLFMHDRVNTRGLLQRKNMVLDSYTCELCILQKIEILCHLFVKCNFTRQCWESIGIMVPMHLQMLQVVARMKRRLSVPF